jgi:hypothetical protein
MINYEHVQIKKKAPFIAKEQGWERLEDSRASDENPSRCT